MDGAVTTAMAGNALPSSFYGRAPEAVARGLLGHVVCRVARGRAAAGRIVETEAYGGPADPGSHARGGPTPRSRVMWERPGLAYVYFVYGNHDMLNVVAHPPGEAGAVLIRAISPVEGVALMRRRRGLLEAPAHEIANGPGKLCRALGVTVGADNGRPLQGPPLWIASGEAPLPEAVASGPRVGLSDDDGRQHRFWIRHDPHVSRARGSEGPLR